MASLNIPYRTVELGVDHLISLVDRQVYGAAENVAGQWDYMLFYQENFDTARKDFERHIEAFFKLMFAKGDPGGAMIPTITAGVRERGGWFGQGEPPPPAERDDDIVDAAALSSYVAAYEKTGFFGADSYYMNHARNAEYAARSVNDGRIDMPTLFVSADFDYWCDTERNSQFGEGMRRLCTDLTAVSIPAGHWTTQEQPTKVNAALVHWLVSGAHIWPTAPKPYCKPL